MIIILRPDGWVILILLNVFLIWFSFSQFQPETPKTIVLETIAIKYKNRGVLWPPVHLATVADKTKKKQKQSNETHTDDDGWPMGVPARSSLPRLNITRAWPHPHTRLRSSPQASQSAKLCVVQLLSNRAYGKACYTLTNEVRAHSYSLFSFRSFFFHDSGPCWVDPR